MSLRPPRPDHRAGRGALIRAPVPRHAREGVALFKRKTDRIDLSGVLDRIYRIDKILKKEILKILLILSIKNERGGRRGRVSNFT
jgi:hypothetical protein